MASAPTIFTAHVVTDSSSDSPRLVPHRFAWAAFWFGPFWLLRHRLWLHACCMSALAIAAIAAVRTDVIGANGALALWLLLSAFAGMEAQEWRRRALQRRGSPIVGFGYGSDDADVWARAAFDRQVVAQERAAP